MDFSSEAADQPHSGADGVYYALFKVVSTRDLVGEERAIEWAQSLLDDPELLDAFAAEACRHPGPGRRRSVRTSERFARL